MTRDFWADVVDHILSSGVWPLLIFGAVGGATNALVTQVAWREAMRVTLIGALVAGGVGSAALAMIAQWLGLPAEAMAAAGGAGSAGAYLTGIFGGAVIEVMLARIRAGHLPGDGDDGDAANGQ